MLLFVVLLLLAACVCFGLAAAAWERRVNLVALGLLAATLVPLLTYGARLFP